MTRIGILIAWVGGVAMALSFGQMLGLWVFMATILVSTVLVPIMIGLYVPGWRVAGAAGRDAQQCHRTCVGRCLE